jgi:uncharacterized surface protein with fasciclin (FAS1) repeats
MVKNWRFSLTLAIVSLFSSIIAQDPSSLPPKTTSNQSPSTSPAASTPVPQQSIMQIMSTLPEFSKFSVAVKLANLDTLLHYANPLTVFAPNNAAFEKLTPQEIYSFYDPKNVFQLQAIVKSHIVLQSLYPPSFHHLSFKSFQGTTFHINTSTTGVSINEKIKVSLPPILGSNGLIYIIDTVLLPTSTNQ